MSVIFLLLIVNLCLIDKLNASEVDVQQIFKTNGIVPDIIDVAPSKTIKITYQQSNKEVKQGNELTPQEVKNAPTVLYDADPNSFYTLAMVDPDAPSRTNPTKRSWNHWVVVNIPGSQISDGDTLNDYKGSAPPKGTGLHRYVFLVYKQQAKSTFEAPSSGNDRGKFSIKDFSVKYGLGNPIAGNFFQAQNQQ